MMRKATGWVAISMLLFGAVPMVLSGEPVPTIAIEPEIDGDRDGEAMALARTVADTMSFASGFRIVDFDRTRDLSDYNDPARKIDTAGEAEEAIRRAKDHYLRFQYEKATAELKKSMSLIEGKIDEIEKYGPILEDANLTLAIVAKARGREQDIRNALLAALKIDPTLALSEEDYPPSIVAALAEIKKEFLNDAASSIRVATRPKASDVYLNGIAQGSSPIEIRNLPRGIYRISIRANRYASVDRDVELGDGEVVKISEKLKWISDETSTDVNTADAIAEVNRGLLVADAIKVDKAVLIDVDSADDGQTVAAARMVDRRYRAGHRPILVHGNLMDDDMAGEASRIADILVKQARADLTDDPIAKIDPTGIAAPILLGKRKRPVMRSPVFWGAIGAAAAGAIAGGVAAAMSGGSSPGTGAVRVRLK